MRNTRKKGSRRPFGVPRGGFAVPAIRPKRLPALPRIKDGFVVSQNKIVRRLLGQLRSHISDGDSRITLPEVLTANGTTRQVPLVELRIGKDSGPRPEEANEPVNGGKKPNLWSGEKNLPLSYTLVSKVNFGRSGAPSTSIAQPQKMQVYQSEGKNINNVTGDLEFTKAPGYRKDEIGINEMLNKLFTIQLPPAAQRRMMVMQLPSHVASINTTDAEEKRFDIPSPVISGGDNDPSRSLVSKTYFPFEMESNFLLTNLNSTLPVNCKVRLLQVKQNDTFMSGVDAYSPSDIMQQLVNTIPRNKFTTEIADNQTAAVTIHNGVPSGGRIYGYNINPTNAMQTCSIKTKSSYPLSSHPQFDDVFNTIWTANYSMQAGNRRLVEVNHRDSVCPQAQGNWDAISSTNNGLHTYCSDAVFLYIEAVGAKDTPYYRAQKSVAEPESAIIPGTRTFSNGTGPFTLGYKCDVDYTMYSRLVPESSQFMYCKNFVKQNEEDNVSIENNVPSTDIYASEEEFVESSAGLGYFVPVRSNMDMQGAGTMRTAGEKQ